MRRLMLILPMATVLLNGCCGSGCSRFWLDVQQGLFYEEQPYMTAQAAIERTFPASFKSTARVVLRRGTSDSAFTVKLKRDTVKEELRMAAVNDLGNVIFTAAAKGNQVAVIKNNSGWPDTVVSEIIVPLCLQLTTRKLSKDCIVQRFPDGRQVYRTVTSKKEMVELHLDLEGAHVTTVVTRRLGWLGEKEYIRRVYVSEFATFPGGPHKWPKHLNILDEIGGYRANVTITEMQALP